MEESFAASYREGQLSLESFTGNVTLETLRDSIRNPCGETIPVSGGGWSGNGGGSGTGNGGGTGDGGGAGDGGSNGGPGTGGGGSGIGNEQEVPGDLEGSPCDPVAMINCLTNYGGAVWDDSDCTCIISPRYFRVGNTTVVTNLGFRRGNPCGQEEELIGSVGIMDGGLVNNHEDNCNKLKQMSDNNAVKASLESLEEKQNLLDREYGYYYTVDEDGDYVVTEMNGVPLLLHPEQIPTIPFPEGQNAVAAAHTHLNDYNKYVPMFSVQDIAYLFQLADQHQREDGSFKDYSDYVFYVATAEGTYAMKIEKFTVFRAIIRNKYDKDRDFMNNLNNRYLKRDPMESLESYEKDFLEFINQSFGITGNSNLGIALYKADEDLTNWNKLTLDNNGDILSIPCQ